MTRAIAPGQCRSEHRHFRQGMHVYVRDRSAPSHAARSGPARREVLAHLAVDRESKFGPTVASAHSNIDTDT